MNTFLPYPSFEESARALDYRRLGKQRVEAMQLLNVMDRGDAAKGWKNHPATKMWRGYERALCTYAIAMCEEWASRGYRDAMADGLRERMKRYPETGMPPWLGDPELHASHRSNLLRKDPEYYSRHGWAEPPDLAYKWP